MGSQSHTLGYGVEAGLRPESLALDTHQPGLHLRLEETPLGHGSDDAPGWARALLSRGQIADSEVGIERTRRFCFNPWTVRPPSWLLGTALDLGACISRLPRGQRWGPCRGHWVMGPEEAETKEAGF